MIAFINNKTKPGASGLTQSTVKIEDGVFWKSN